MHYTILSIIRTSSFFSNATTQGVAPELSNNVQESVQPAIVNQKVSNGPIEAPTDHRFWHTLKVPQYVSFQFGNPIPARDLALVDLEVDQL